MERTSRPRVAGDREEEVLDAVATTLMEVGYDKLTFDLVAAAASVSKATLYRRWPTKAELVGAALASEHSCPLDGFPETSTGSLEKDFELMSCAQGNVLARIPPVIMAIAPALHRDAELARAFRRAFLAPRRERVTRILVAARERGEIGPDASLDALAVLLPSMALMHIVEHGVGPSDEYLREVIRTILIPAARAGLTPPAAPAR